MWRFKREREVKADTLVSSLNSQRFILLWALRDEVPATYPRGYTEIYTGLRFRRAASVENPFWIGYLWVITGGS